MSFVAVALGILLIVACSAQEDFSILGLSENKVGSKLLHRSYSKAHRAATANAMPLMVFLIRNPEPTTVQFVNEQIVEMERLGAVKYMNLATVAAGNPNMSVFPQRDTSIEVVAYFTRQKEGKPQRYSKTYAGQNSVKKLCKEVVQWLERKQDFSLTGD